MNHGSMPHGQQQQSYPGQPQQYPPQQQYMQQQSGAYQQPLPQQPFQQTYPTQHVQQQQFQQQPALEYPSQQLPFNYSNFPQQQPSPQYQQNTQWNQYNTTGSYQAGQTVQFGQQMAGAQGYIPPNNVWQDQQQQPLYQSPQQGFYQGSSPQMMQQNSIPQSQPQPHAQEQSGYAQHLQPPKPRTTPSPQVQQRTMPSPSMRQGYAQQPQQQPRLQARQPLTENYQQPHALQPQGSSPSVVHQTMKSPAPQPTTSKKPQVIRVGNGYRQSQSPASNEAAHIKPAPAPQQVQPNRAPAQTNVQSPSPHQAPPHKFLSPGPQSLLASNNHTPAANKSPAAVDTAQFVRMHDIQRLPTPPAARASKLHTPSQSRDAMLKGHPASTGIVTPKAKPQSPRKASLQSPATPLAQQGSRSPASSNKMPTQSTTHMMVNIAEDLIGTARDAAAEISRTMSEDEVDEYQRMISTALGCLEAAMQSQKLSPREEALIRLRYAGVIQEETEDIMEAETTLTKGITLCEKHRLQDLKYAMQYLLTKVLFQRNHKAGIKALDQHIVECDTYRHFHWAYAFRLLKHSFYTETGGFGDNAALDNIRSVYTMASERGDAAVAVYASLSEALMLIKTCKGHFEGIRTCLAQAEKYQFDPTIKIPQLELLHVLVDFLGGLQRDPPAETSARLQRLQACSDAHQSADAQFWIPIKKSQYESTTISKDTATVVRPGGAGETFDFLVMAYISVNDLVLVSLVMGGTFYLHKSLSQNTALGMWERAQGILHQAEKMQSTNTRARPVPLGLAVKEREWREQVQCYLHVLFSLHHISECNWGHARDVLALAEQVRRTLRLDGLAKTYLVYAQGAYNQGTGYFQDALACFESDCLSLHAQPSTDSQRHLASLAAMNRLWIMQRPEFTDNEMTSRLMDEVDPFCLNHPNADLRGVWMAVKASITMTPPRRNDSRTTEAKGAMTLLGQSKSLGNSLGLAIALKVTHTLLFNTVLGDKAVSCLEAAKKWADFSNNPLWQSVVAGSFVELAEKGNDRDKWVKHNAEGVEAAQRAFQMP